MSIGKSSTGKVKITDGNDDALVTAAGALHVNVRNNAGTEMGTLANPFYVNSSATGGSTDVKIFDSNAAAIENGQKTMANSLPVAIASDQTAIPVTDNGGSITVDGSVSVTGTVAVSAASLPLPSGASTASNQTDGSQKTQIVDAGGDLVDVIQLATNPTSTQKGLITNSIIHGLSTAGGGAFVDVKVNPSGSLEIGTVATVTSVTNVVHVDDNGGSLTVDATSLPLPTGAATESTLSTLNGKVPSNLTVTATRLLVDGSGVTQPVSASSLPLPLGAATSALQTTGNTSLATIAGAVSGTEVQVDVITMPTTTVQATNLDIRDLSAASDSVAAHGDVGIIDQFDLTNSNPAAVAIVDANGDQITSFGGGTQYADGTAAATPTGTQTNWNESGTQRAVSLTKALPVQPGTGAAFPVTDNGGSLTVDGTIAATQSGTWTLGANSGVDIGDVTINNASGASAVNIQDGGNSITVDGTITASNTAGDVAHDTADSGNPIKIGFKAKNLGSLITPVTDGDRVNGTADRYGAQFVVQGSSFIQAINADYSSAQTNVAIITAGANESIRVYTLTVNIDYDAQVAPSIYIGYGAASTPTTSKCIFANTGMVPGCYVIPFTAPTQGASGEDLRITCDSPVNGNISIQVIYDLVVI